MFHRHVNKIPSITASVWMIIRALIALNIFNNCRSVTPVLTFSNIISYITELVEIPESLVFEETFLALSKYMARVLESSVAGARCHH